MNNNNYKVIELPTEDESARLGEMLASCLRAPLTITFSGEIGAGKTSVIRAMIRALGVESTIKSPTFSLIESYKLPQTHIHHFDLYRILDASELDYIGFRDYFLKDALCFIEWPERAPRALDRVDIKVTLEHTGTGRRAQIRALSPDGLEVLSCWMGK